MKLFRKNFKPTRDANESAELVTDLDALVNERISFRLGGKTYTIKPLSAGEAFVVWNNLSRLDHLRTQNEVSYSEVLNFYADLFKSVCPDITRKHVEDMSQTQCAALLQLVLDTVTGRVFTDGKKKAMNQDSFKDRSTQRLS
jgi:hypothetical protein